MASSRVGARIRPCKSSLSASICSVSYTHLEELEKRLAQALRKKQPLFVFHWRGGGLNRDTLQQLLALAGRLAAEREMCIRDSS